MHHVSLDGVRGCSGLCKFKNIHKFCIACLNSTDIPLGANFVVPLNEIHENLLSVKYHIIMLSLLKVIILLKTDDASRDRVTGWV